MNLSDRDIALLMVACNNTSAGLREAVRRGAADRCQDEAEGLDDLYNRLNNERVGNAEYDRGYQDGLDQFPVADDATQDYDVGYEDGILDAQLPDMGPAPTPKEEAEEEMRYAAGRPWEHN